MGELKMSTEELLVAEAKEYLRKANDVLEKLANLNVMVEVTGTKMPAKAPNMQKVVLSLGAVMKDLNPSSIFRV